MAPDLDVVRRIRKLLALSRDPANPHEAAAAAAKVQDLLSAHKLTLTDLAAEEFTTREVPFIRAPWRQVLAAVLAKHNFCRVIAAPPVRFLFVGQADDVTAVLSLYLFLSRVIARQSRAGYAARVAELTDPVLGPHPGLAEPGDRERWIDSFRVGAVEIIGSRLAKAEAPRAQTGTALVLARHTGKLDAHVTERFGALREMTETELNISLDGLAKGVVAGKGLTLNRGSRRLR